MTATNDHDSASLIEALHETLSSEHCSYAHTRPLIRGLMARMPELHVDPCGNSGWVDFDGRHGLSLRIESHNHPSAIEPFEGAATGVGGIIRDVLASGARPIALADGLMFGGSQSENMAIAAGIAHYANTCGIPTIAGETRRSADFASAPLVNVMCVGFAERAGFERPLRPLRAGDSLVLVGAPTGKDGLGGAVFASRSLSPDDRKNRDPIQKSDAFLGHMLIRFMNEIDKSDIAAKDLGAGGLGVAVYELCCPPGETSPPACGVEVELSKVPLRDADIGPLEILLSESQERILIGTSDPDRIVEAAERNLLAAAVIGRATWRDVVVQINGTKIVVPPCGLRESPLDSFGPGRPRAVSGFSEDENVDPSEVYGQYDWSVGGRTAIGPGAGRAGLIFPRGLSAGVAVALTSNRLKGRTGIADSVTAAFLNAKERIESVGAVPLGATNGVNVGDPETPDVASDLSEIFQGLERAFESTGIPIVSGNVSCYNTAIDGDAAHPIPPTVYIGMVGRCPQS